MKALCWHGRGDVRVDTVPDSKIEQPTDCIVKITASGICGSDLHLLDGFMPTMKSGDIHPARDDQWPRPGSLHRCGRL